MRWMCEGSAIILFDSLSIVYSLLEKIFQTHLTIFLLARRQDYKKVRVMARLVIL